MEVIASVGGWVPWTWVDGLARGLWRGAAATLLLVGCASDRDIAPAAAGSEAWQADRSTAMEVDLLTYNVAGLPDFLSAARPSINHSIISARLNRFDLVLVQEDFWYHHDLASAVRLAYASAPSSPSRIWVGDGLNRFSASSFEHLVRQRWARSHGVFGHASDSLAPKGFTVATHHFGRDLAVDIYNLDLDAGKHRNDSLARQAQLEQLADAVAARSAGRAVIIGGDWNVHENRPGDVQALVALK
jgi:hypothetical protein